MFKFLLLAVAICVIAHANARLLKPEELDIMQGNSVDDFTKELSFVDLYDTLKPTLRSAAKKNSAELIKSTKALKTLYFNVKDVVEGNPIPVVTVDKINELVCHETTDASIHQQ